jgi:hypothetical protein
MNKPDWDMPDYCGKLCKENKKILNEKLLKRFDKFLQIKNLACDKS